MVVIESNIYINGCYSIFNTVSLDLKLPSIIVSISLLSTPILSLLVSTLLLREIDTCIYTTVDSTDD